MSDIPVHPQSSSWRAWIPAAVLTFGMALAGVAVAATPRADSQLAVVLPSPEGFAEVTTLVDQAGGSVKAIGAAGHLVVTNLTGLDHAETLRRLGAWIVIDATAAQGCFRL